MSVCALCERALVYQITDPTASDGPKDTGICVPDDYGLSCGHHFHWLCLVDNFEGSCPRCHQDVSTSNPDGTGRRILSTVRNEGGEQRDEDLFATLQEEHWLRQHPQERKSRAFLTFCRAMDLEAVLDMMDEFNNEDELLEEVDAISDPNMHQVLRYQDSQDNGVSPLHVAVELGAKDLVYVLLHMASNVPEELLPAQMVQCFEGLDLFRPEQEGLADIRSLRDARGQTAYDLAQQRNIPDFDSRILAI